MKANAPEKIYLDEEDLARKIIEIIDAYGDDKISTINVIEKYCMQKVQEKEIVCNTIENEITNYCKSHFKSDNVPNEWKESGIAFSAGKLVNFASHFANWQKQLMMKDVVDAFIEKACSWFADRYQANGSYLCADDIEDFEKYMRGE